MKNEMKKLVPPKKSFWVAIACVPPIKGTNWYAVPQTGYSLSEKNGETRSQYNSSGEMKCTPGREVCWVSQSSSHEVDVPWGLQIDDPDGKKYAVNGIVRVRILDPYVNVYSNLSLRCDTITKDGVSYQLLSDHFIDEEKKHQGLSIAIRDLILPDIRNRLINKSFESVQQEIEKMKKDAQFWKTRLAFNHEIASVTVEKFEISTQEDDT